jgi:peptidoglycan/LPS O-acetylase OafA/YrhL
MKKRSHLAALTGLRFVAALHVALFHEASGLVAGVPVVERLVGTGYIGVQLFFVLSGFILAYNYSSPRTARAIDLDSFWVARFARVYPVYFLSLLVALPILVTWAVTKVSTESTVGSAKVLVTVVANLGLLQSWVLPTMAEWNFPGWSLSCEAFFYLLFPLAATRISTLPFRRIVWTIGACWLIGLLIPIAYAVHNPASTPNTGGLLMAAVKYSPLLRLPEFLIGIAFGQLYLRREEAGEPHKSRSAFSSSSVALVILVILALPAWIPYPLMHNVLLAPLFGMLIFALASGEGALARMLSNAWVVILGQASYAFYLLHEPLATLLYKLPGAPIAQLGAWPRLFLYLAILTAFSIATLFGWEEPSRRAIRRWWAARGERTVIANQARVS